MVRVTRQIHGNFRVRNYRDTWCSGGRLPLPFFPILNQQNQELLSIYEGVLTYILGFGDKLLYTTSKPETF
jgi:hypothetical protein